MACNCEEIAQKGKQKVEESLAMKLLQDTRKHSKRWFVAWLVTFIALVGVIGGIVYIVLTSDIAVENVGINTDNGTVNYIGNDNNGDIDNGIYPTFLMMNTKDFWNVARLQMMKKLSLKCAEKRKALHISHWHLTFQKEQ